MLESRAWGRFVRLLRLVTLGAAVACPLLYLVLVALRIGYPFELEWMEGGSLGHVVRVLAGERLYVPPSLEFTPFVYPPLYYYASGAAALLLGPGFLPLRLVSVVASLGVFAVIAALVRRETGSAPAAVLAVGLFAATYRFSGAWLDLARADSLFLLLLLAAVYILRRGSSRAAAASGGAFLALAALTKQTALVVAALVCLHALLWDRRRAPALVGAFLALAGGAFLALDLASDGWYRYYTVVVPRGHVIVPRVLLLFWTRDVFPHLGIASVGAAFWFVAQLLQRRLDAARFYSCLALGMLGVSLVARANVGGYDNVLLPACAVLSILFGLGAHEALRAAREASSERRDALEGLVYVACLVQLAGLLYSPSAQVPAGSSAEAGRRLVRRLSEIRGEVFVPGHPYLLTLAGRRSQAHFMAMDDLLRHGTPEVRERLASELGRALRDGRFAALVLDSGEWFREDVKRAYGDGAPVFDDPAAFWPVTGARLRPERIYFPRDVGAASAPSISRTMDATASAGSGDSVTGRPTTR